MRLNRSLIVPILVVVIVICAGILLSGCASVADGKDAGAKRESSPGSDNRRTAAKEAGGSSAEVARKPVSYTGGSGEKQRAQAANLKAGKGTFTRNAGYIKQALDRILPATLPEVNWNRIATILTGILVMLMIYGLAFGLGRLSARRRGVGRRGGGRQTGEQARGPVPQ